jgi:N-acetyltransferase 10
MEKSALQYFITVSDLNRLKSYTKNQVDYHLVLDLIPAIARLYFTSTLGRHINLGYINQAILVGVGLQMKSFDDICKEIKDLEVRNALPLFQKTVIKFTKLIQRCFEVPPSPFSEISPPLSRRTSPHSRIRPSPTRHNSPPPSPIAKRRRSSNRGRRKNVER